MRLPVTGYIDSAFFDLALKQCEPCLNGKDKTLELDLSSVEFGSPAGLVSLAALLRLMKGRGVAITVANYPRTLTSSDGTGTLETQLTTGRR